MAYREENDQVILTMSRDDYKRLMMSLNSLAVVARPTFYAFLDRLNSGNLNYTPYQVEEMEEKKS